MKKYFIDNTHAIRTIVTPDNLFTDYMKVEKTEYLKTVKENLTIQDIDFLKQEVIFILHKLFLKMQIKE